MVWVRFYTFINRRLPCQFRIVAILLRDKNDLSTVRNLYNNDDTSHTTEIRKGYKLKEKLHLKIFFKIFSQKKIK